VDVPHPGWSVISESDGSAGEERKPRPALIRDAVVGDIVDEGAITAFTCKASRLAICGGYHQRAPLLVAGRFTREAPSGARPARHNHGDT
jgi:hypothetical protein